MLFACVVDAERESVRAKQQPPTAMQKQPAYVCVVCGVWCDCKLQRVTSGEKKRCKVIGRLLLKSSFGAVNVNRA
jgi:hypothetical protein